MSLGKYGIGIIPNKSSFKSDRYTGISIDYMNYCNAVSQPGYPS